VKQPAPRPSAMPPRDVDVSPAGLHVDDAYLPIAASGKRGSTRLTLSNYSGLGERTLRAYLTHPVHPLPCYRIGGKVLVRRSDFDEWARQFRAAPTSAVDALVTDALRGL
jgi:Helix-turn-helix domain